MVDCCIDKKINLFQNLATICPNLAQMTITDSLVCLKDFALQFAPLFPKLNPVLAFKDIKSQRNQILNQMYVDVANLLSFSPNSDDNLLLVISRDKPQIVLFIDWKHNELIYSITVSLIIEYLIKLN